MAFIDFDYGYAIRQAEEIENAAAILSRNAMDIERSLHKAVTYWSGENAELYNRKGSELQKECMRSAQELRLMSAQVRENAEELMRIERENSQVFES